MPALAALVLALIGQVAAAPVRVTEQLIAAREPGVTWNFLASPDARRLAWVEQADSRQRVVLDGRPVASYPLVTALTFSADGSGLAFAARLDPAELAAPEWTVALAGQEFGRFAEVDPPVLDRAGAAVGFTALERFGPRAAFINGARQSDRDTAVPGSVVLSPTGGRSARIERAGRLARVVADGIGHPWRDFISRSSLGFSPDGAHLGYIAGHLDPVFIFDGRVIGAADAMVGPAYDSTGAAVAWALRDGPRWRLYARYPGRVIDREPAETPLELVFSPDGTRLAAALRRPLGTTIVLLDDSVIAEQDAVKGLCFSPDGSSVGWIARVSNGWRVVAGGRVSPRYADVSRLALGPLGRYACAVPSGRGLAVLLDGSVAGRYDELLSGIVFESGNRIRFIARRRNRYLLVRAELPSVPGG